MKQFHVEDYWVGRKGGKGPFLAVKSLGAPETVEGVRRDARAERGVARALVGAGSRP